jgi:hypothetical protein
MEKVEFFLNLANRFLTLDERTVLLRSLQSAIDVEKLNEEIKENVQSRKGDSEEILEKVVSPGEFENQAVGQIETEVEKASVKEPTLLKKKSKGKSRFKKRR